MVYNLALFGHQVEITVHLIIVEGADAGRTQSKRFSSEVQALANSACFKMDIAIATVAIAGNGTLEIANHRKGHAAIAGQILPEAQSSGCNALVATLGLLQLGSLRPEPVDTGLQSINAVSIQIQLNE